MKRHKAPGKAHREGITVVQLMDMFPDETTARQWFEQMVWNGERCCGHCGGLRTKPVPNDKPMPYWCADCRGYFSVRTGTILERSHVPLRKWVIAIYLELTSLKSVSSMKLHRDIGVRQATAWFMLHRIREAWKVPGGNSFAGPVEIDETFFGGKAALLHGPEQIADLPVPVAESPGAVRIGHPERSHLVEYLAPNSVFNSLPRQRSSPHLRPDDRLVTIDRVLHHASLGVA